MKTYRLFLDDIRTPMDAWKYTGFDPYFNQYWKIVRNYEEFTDNILREYKKSNFPELIGFDHDLSFEHYSDMMGNAEEYNKLSKTFQEKTGMDCAKWLVEFCMNNDLKLPEFYVHSMNPVGKENIESYLNNFKRRYEY